MKQLVFILLFACISGFFSVTNAQISTLPQTNINVSMTPENPGPNELVYVSVVSYSTNINAAKITWVVDGKIQKSETGAKSFTFKTGDLNTTTSLDILIETREGEVLEKNFKIKPVSIDLIWESDGFVPPFYRGKSLFSHQNKITVIALPHIMSESGNEIGAKNLIYTWKKNGSVIENASGFGKNSYSFISPLISRPFTISVEVVSVDNSGVAYGSLNLSPGEPSVLFYKKDPIYGIEFQNALSNTVELKNSKELVVVGVPLFFGKSGLVYKWAINGFPINTGDSGSTQVFRQVDGSSGTSRISLSVENPRKILQYAGNNFNLTFGNNDN
jgi:hypothetical protein